MNDSMTFSVLLLLFSVFISAVSQILLKKAAQKHYPNQTERIFESMGDYGIQHFFSYPQC